MVSKGAIQWLWLVPGQSINGNLCRQRRVMIGNMFVDSVEKLLTRSLSQTIHACMSQCLCRAWMKHSVSGLQHTKLWIIWQINPSVSDQTTSSVLFWFTRTLGMLASQTLIPANHSTFCFTLLFLLSSTLEISFLSYSSIFFMFIPLSALPLSSHSFFCSTLTSSTLSNKIANRRKKGKWPSRLQRRKANLKRKTDRESWNFHRITGAEA